MIKVILFALLLVISYETIAQSNNCCDALIIFNKENRIFNYTRQSNGLYTFEVVTKISRRIKILSEYGLSQFATLYIPTYWDVNYKTELISITAQTIKPTGVTYQIPQNNIKETTLPANIPFLRKYKGNVKSMAFENLDVNDEIQYDYQIRYLATSSYSYFFNSIQIVVPEDYSMQAAEYSFTLNNDIQFKGIVVNSDYKFSKTNTNEDVSVYTLRLKDIKPVKDEPFSIPEDNLLYLKADIYKTNKVEPYEKWDDLTRDFKSADSYSKFFAGKSIYDIYKACKEEPNAVKKVLKAHQIMMVDLLKTPKDILLLDHFHPDMEDVNQIFKLLKLLDINGSVLLVKNKNNGKVIREFVSNSQFDEMLIEFYDKGEVHYFPIFNPFAKIDEINAAYFGTEALKMGIVAKKEVVSFVNFPQKRFDEGIEKYVTYINLVIQPNDLLLKCKTTVQKSGQSFLDHKNEYLLELADKDITLFSQAIKDEFKNSFTDCEVDTILLQGNKEKIDYTMEYNYSLTENQPDYFRYVKLSDIVQSEFLMSDYRKERNSMAYFNYPREITRKIIISTNNGYTVVPNNLIKVDFENELGKIKSDITVTPSGTLELTLIYKIKQNELDSGKWSLFLTFIKEAQNILNQRILIRK